MTLQDPCHALSPIDLAKVRYDNFGENRFLEGSSQQRRFPAPKENTLQNTIWNNVTVSGETTHNPSRPGKTDDRRTVMLENLPSTRDGY